MHAIVYAGWLRPYYASDAFAGAPDLKEDSVDCADLCEHQIPEKILEVTPGTLRPVRCFLGISGIRFFHLWIHFQVELWIDQLKYQEANYDCVMYR